ncbi:MAG: DNA mismatch repair endonuclease MutL [Clostridia bacterium]|nr:DNA mismatch repair endonuclease MutL [Clostridia bacterium]MBR4261212.1 DNA mismatch repair endonuclease MutL [Clostridia bacterium]
MGNIVLLDDLTINKIAAGEVIERPASVVKELVENSIDAGADNISIEIKNGGISYIRITDNGKGIAADDLEIAFERHATSKIRNADDLTTVKSMGFRGEALASIAAIARVELVTKTEDSEVGHKIVVEGGKVILKEETGCPKGTSITIENLFYNTPVRYKFLKKDFTESGYIEDCVTRIALVNPNIAIKFINSGKTVIQTTGNGEIKDIIYGIYGKDVAENIINVEYYFEDMAVKGVIGKPAIARSNRANQLFFVNKRYVKDKTLTSGAEQAFKGMLPIGKYGFLILNIEMDPSKLDVNVHPAKLEVRFQDESKIFKLIYHAIKETLLKGNIGEPETKASSSDEGLFQKSYIEDLNNLSTIQNDYEVKAENSVDNTEHNSTKNEHENTESKGIGGFFKNILGGSKNEFATNDENLVEQLYKDKMNREHENMLNDSDDNTKEMNIIKPESLESAISKENSNKTEFNKDQTQPIQSSNLERLIKELDANLEKLNMKPQEIGMDKLNDNFGIENDNLGIENGIQETINTETTIVDMLENNGLEATAETAESIVENDTTKIDNNETTEQITNDSNPTTVDNKTEENKPKEPDSNFEEMYAKMFGTTIPKRDKVEEEEKAYAVKQEDFKTVENMSLFTNNSFYSRPVYKYIGIVFDSYIVIEYENEMYIVNQRAANERILYERVKKNYYNDSDKESQLMLLPDVINLTPRQMGIAQDNLQLFKKAGFDVEEFGDNTIKLNGVPNICIELDTKKLFLDILDEINTVARTSRDEIEDKFISTVACKAAEKSKIALTAQEVDLLMQQLLSLPHPFMNPNGEPTAIRMSKIDIEKKFSRR